MIARLGLPRDVLTVLDERAAEVGCEPERIAVELLARELPGALAEALADRWAGLAPDAATPPRSLPTAPPFDSLTSDQADRSIALPPATAPDGSRGAR